ncbi:MAG: hypothetical protein C5B53_00680 [Candidatus Melainabacteria bacterium]|nr:MAG: hypothetical protein C5B53_00680 [Candidatus Melainabacteria bacterium]
MDSFVVFKRLKTAANQLDLSCLNVKDDELVHLALIEVEHISFAGNPHLTIEGLKKLAPKGDKYRFIDFMHSGIKIDDAGLLTITELFPNVTTLWLGGAGFEVTPEGLKALARCAHLQDIAIADPVLLAAVKKLFRQLKVSP